jgi:hypothetical protein
MIGLFRGGMIMRLFVIAAICLGATGVVAADSPVNVAGKWKLVWNVEHGPGQTSPQTMNILLNVAQSAGQVSGKAVVMLDVDKEPPANQDTHPISGSVEGANIAFAIPPHYESPDFKITFSGAIDGNSMSGKTNMGDRWTATRVRAGAGGKLIPAK